MAFLDALVTELGAKRRRLRRALGDWRASLVEALTLAGLAFGLFGPIAYPRGETEFWHGLLPPLGLAVGLVLLEARRQGALGRGVTEERLRRGFDGLTLALMAAMAVAGVSLYAVSAATVPEATTIEVPDAIPEDAVIIDLSGGGAPTAP